MVFHSTGKVHRPNFIKSHFEEKLSGSNTLAYFTRGLSDGKIKNRFVTWYQCLKTFIVVTDASENRVNSNRATGQSFSSLLMLLKIS